MKIVFQRIDRNGRADYLRLKTQSQGDWNSVGNVESATVFEVFIHPDKDEEQFIDIVPVWPFAEYDYAVGRHKEFKMVPVRTREIVEVVL